MLLRLTASKDTFVTNKMVNGRRVTGSNAGASEILQVYKMSTPPQSGTQGHILIAFPTASAVTAFSASYHTGSIGWFLMLKNVDTQNPNVNSFDIEIAPMQTNWDEGRGHDLDYFTDKGNACWDFARTGVPWVSGGLPALPGRVPYHFDTGHEDVELDVTSIINGGTYGVSNGFWIGISSTLVQDANDYYLKAFRSRQTHFPQYQPYLEARWNDVTSSYTSAFISIVDATGTLVGSIYNLKTTYDRSETPTLKAYFRPKDWNLSVVTTASADVSGTVLTNAYYRVVDDIADEVVIPFGTGSALHTKLSYNDAGNYFRFPMLNLVPGLVYRFDIGYYDAAGDWHLYRGDDLTFRVV